MFVCSRVLAHLVTLYLATDSGVIRITLKSRFAAAMGFVTNTHANGMRSAFLVDTNGYALSAARQIWTTNEVVGTIGVALAFVRNYGTILYPNKFIR